MKTLVCVALLFCAGCGSSEVEKVSEQEKLAKRLNDKMDKDEAEKVILRQKLEKLYKEAKAEALERQQKEQDILQAKD